MLGTCSLSDPALAQVPSTEGGGFLSFVLLAILIVVLGGLLKRTARKRNWHNPRRGFELRRQAVRHGFNFWPARGPRLPRRPPLETFLDGFSWRGRYLIEGRFDGVRVDGFDFWTWSGDAGAAGADVEAQEITEWVGALATVDRVLLPLSILSQGIWRRLEGRYDILPVVPFESEEFERRFRVQCSNSRYATDLLMPGVLDALTQAPEDASFEFNQCWVLGYAPNLTPEDTIALMRAVAGARAALGDLALSRMEPIDEEHLLARWL